MTTIQAALLALIQGLAEFLPISSSGHIELGKAILGLDAENGADLGFTVLLHLGTALSTIVVFRKSIFELIKGVFAFKWNFETKYCCYILVSMIPAGILALFFKDDIEKLFSGSIILVGSMLIVTGLLLLIADRAKDTDKNINFFKAFIIGISQAIAILPGISRSGATISTSVMLKIDRKKAARFSFLMVLPIIFGEVILDLLKGDTEQLISSGLQNSVIGFIVAFLTGLFACKLMIKLVEKAKLTFFAFYCFAVGFIAIVFHYF